MSSRRLEAESRIAAIGNLLRHHVVRSVAGFVAKENTRIS
jgi:hypothetical protein